MKLCTICRKISNEGNGAMCPECWDNVPIEIKRRCYAGTITQKAQGFREAKDAARTAIRQGVTLALVNGEQN
jgi:hypothetical protein